VRNHAKRNVALISRADLAVLGGFTETLAWSPLGQHRAIGQFS
jgi:hypothetical protein